MTQQPQGDFAAHRRLRRSVPDHREQILDVLSARRGDELDYRVAAVAVDRHPQVARRPRLVVFADQGKQGLLAGEFQPAFRQVAHAVARREMRQKLADPRQVGGCQRQLDFAASGRYGHDEQVHENGAQTARGHAVLQQATGESGYDLRENHPVLTADADPERYSDDDAAPIVDAVLHDDLHAEHEQHRQQHGGIGSHNGPGNGEDQRQELRRERRDDECQAEGDADAAQAQTNQLSISAPADANEGNAGSRDLSFTVTLDTSISANVVFDVCFTGTATIDTTATFPAGADYQLTQNNSPWNLNCITSNALHSGTTSQTSVGIRVKGDTEAERDETVIATLSFRGTPPNGVTLGTSTATHTIQNDDAIAVQLLPTSDVTFTEQTPSDAAAMTVRLERRLYAGEQLAVPIEFIVDTVGEVIPPEESHPSFGASATGTGVTSTSWGTVPGYVRFTGHDTNTVQEATITLTPTSNDDGNMLDGSLRARLVELSAGDWGDSFTNVRGGGEPHGTDDEVRLIYADNDIPAPCTNCAWITGGDAVTEGGDAVFTVHVNPPTADDVTVPLWVYDSPGNSVANYVLYRHENYEEVTIPSGLSAATHTVPTKDDDRDEPDGSVRVEISGTPTGPDGRYYEIPNIDFFPYYRARGPQSASVAVWDDDANLPRHVPPSVSVSTLWGAARPSRLRSSRRAWTRP